MCLYQPDRMEYAPVLQGLVLHATWVLRDGVVLDIQPDYTDPTGEGIMMSPQQPMPILPVQPICIGSLFLGLMAGSQQALCSRGSYCLPHLLWCLMLPLLLYCRILL